MKKENYRIDKNTYKTRLHMWNAHVEVFIALAAEAIEKYSLGIYKKDKVAKEILEKYVRKRSNSQISATKIMRGVWSEK